MELFSPEWCDRVTDAAAAVRLGEDRAGSFELVAGDARANLVITAGKVAVASGAMPAADVGLGWSPNDADRIARGLVSGTEAMVCTTASSPASGTGYVGPPAPLGLMTRPEADALPELFGATVRVQFEHPGGPLGGFGRYLDFDSGRIVDEQFGTAPTHDVFLKIPYRAMALVGTGEISVLDALAAGEVKGDLAAIATLAGILDTDEFKALMLAGSAQCVTLSVLGELRADAAFRDGFARVMVDTEAP